MPHYLRLVPTVALAILVSTSAASAQIPKTFTNLQVLPETMPREAVLQRMREFSFALGVRCQHCHAGGDGISFDGVSFGADDKAAKRTARDMMRMTQSLNASGLAVDCAMCHRGRSRPGTIRQQMARLIASDGAAAAIAHYRRERTATTASGGFEFSEWEMNELARELAEQGNRSAAIQVLEMNAEYQPHSAEIDVQLGDLHRADGDIPLARSRYERALKKAPGHARALERLKSLR